MKTSFDLALVQCPGWGRECPPNALACLAAYVRAKGYSAVCFDLNNAFYDESPEHRKMWDDKDYYSFWEDRGKILKLIEENEALMNSFVERILDSGVSVVGFSTHTTSFLVSLELAKRIKSRDPQKTVVFGGPQCSRAQAGIPFAAEESVDAVVVGEGEETLVAVLNSVLKKGKIEPVPGLILRTEHGVKDCGDRELLGSLDDLPIPDYSDFASAMAEHRYADPKRLESYDIRGCVRSCHFCSEWQFWRRFRTMSGRRMFAEVSEQMKRHPHVSHFYFIGSLLNGAPRQLEDFCDLVLSSGTKISWEGQAIVSPRMDGRMFSKMAAAGCSWLGFGIETGSERLRREMNKGFSNEEACSVLKAAHDAGIQVQINIMFGMPTETRQDFEETLDFLARVRPHIDSVLASQSFMVLDKGTEPYLNPGKYGIEGREHHLFWSSNGGANDYAERFRRYEVFCRLALELGLPETSGVLRLKPDKWRLLGEFFEHKRDWPRAIACLRRSLRLESENKTILAKLADCYRAAGRMEHAKRVLEAVG